MFVGRKEELEILNDHYNNNGFDMIVLYGRRRVGKSYLLKHFFSSLSTNVIAFQSIENSTTLSIEAFAESILSVFPSRHDISLDSWKKCFSYLNEQIKEEKVVICIDEINYIFKSDNTFASQLQNEIDNHLKDKNVLLIVCGSNINSIESNILKSNSPLYGRRNLSIKLKEFDYRSASEFYPNYSNEDKVIAYSVFGGKAKNLASINPNLSVKQNIIKQILTPGGALADEIDLLMKDDFRDSTFYKELLHIMSLGNSTFNDIQTQAHEESSKVSIYLKKLIDLKIIDKVEMNERKNDARYFIQDNFFSFYFRFIHKRKGILNILVTPEVFYDRFIENDLLSFVGLKYEGVCEQYIINKSFKGELDFVPLQYGKYFGKHRNGSTFDIDVFFKDDNNLLCGECKFTNKPFNMSDIQELIDNSKEISVKKYSYYVFSKSGIDSAVVDKYPDINLVSLNQLFE